MLPTLNIKSTIKTFKLLAIEIKHSIGEMDYKPILHKFFKFNRSMKMHHMVLQPKKQTLINSFKIKLKNKSLK